MGWRSWNAYRLAVDQDLMLAQVAALAAPGPDRSPSLLAAGYEEIGIDDGWQACGAGVAGGYHDDAGKPIVNETLFPDMLAMTRLAHSQGVKMGWYMNNCWCRWGDIEAWGATGGTVVQDVAATMAFEFDGLKVDGCGPSHNITLWGEALKAASAASGRDVVLENCADNGAEIEWTAATTDDVETCDFQTYRVSRDISPHYNSVMWNLQQTIPFADAERPLSRPGCWAYPDMMQVGGGRARRPDGGQFPYGGLSPTEGRSHFAAWCVTSSPLILGFDLTNETMLEEVRPIITNARALEINQAWYGHPGTLVRNSSDTLTLGIPHAAECTCCDDLSTCDITWDAPLTQLWAKPLSDQKVAVLVLNHDDEAHEECFSARDIGLKGNAFTLVDVWSGDHSPVITDSFCCNLESHNSCFFTAVAETTLVV